MKVVFKGEKSKVFLFYTLLIGVVYFQVTFCAKTLIPNLYYPKQFTRLECKGRIPVNSLNIDLATPSFYEMPMNKTVGNMYSKGELPLWNPYQGCGTPLAAQYSTRVFFPYQILEDISPFWLWDYFMLGRLLVAAFFTYLFLRLLGVSAPCSFLGGTLYSLSGSFVWFINLEQFVNVAMMVPVCLFSLERFLQFKKMRYFAESAAAITFMILAGQPEIAIYVILLLSAYYIFRVIVEKPKILFFLKEILKFTGLSLLGLGLCAFLVLPFLEFIPNSYQCHPLGGTMGVQEPTRLYVAINTLIPSFTELPTSYRIFPHNGIWDWLGGYSGILAFYLILLGFFYKGGCRKFFLFFSLFGFFIILKNFGSPLASWLGKFPLFDQSWSPRWAGCVWTFSIACAGALGLEVASQTLRKRKILPWGIFLSFLSVVAFLAYKTTYFSQFKDLGADSLKAVLPPVLSGVAVGVFVILTAAYIICYCKSEKSLIYGVICLAIFELWFYIPKGASFPWTALKLVPFLLGIIVVFFLAREKRNFAIAGIILVILSYTFIDLKSPNGFPDRCSLFKEPGYVKFLKKHQGFYRTIAGDGILMPNFSGAFGVFDVRYINSLSSLYYQNYVDQHLLQKPHAWITDRLWFTGLSDIHKRKLRSIYEEINDNLLYYSYLGIKYIIAPQSASASFPLAYDKEVKIYENSHCLERVYIARNIEHSSDYKKAQELIGKSNFDIKNTVVIEEKEPEWYNDRANSSPSGGRTAIEEYAANKVRISANLEADGMLVLTDTFYPGWRAYVDGEETKIYRINGLVRGVFLREGRHSIEFIYFPLSFRIGLVISLIFFVFLAILLLIEKRRLKKTILAQKKI